jgi:hypothetical protein
MFEPGTVMSGLMRPSAAGPQLLKVAMESALVPCRVAPTETPFLLVEGLPTEPVPGAGVAGGVEDQEVLVIPHDLVGVLAGGGVVVLHRGVLVVAPGVGVQPRALVVGLEEDGLEVDDRAADARQVAAVVGEEAGVLNHQLGARSHAVGRVVGEQMGEVVPRHGAGHVGAMALRVPLARRDAPRALGGGEEVHGEDLALGGVDHGAAVAEVGGRQAAGRIAEEAHVGVEAGVDDADDLPLAEDALAEDGRRLPAGEAGLPHPDGGVVAQRLAPFEVDPEDVAHRRQGPAQSGDLGGSQQQADTGEVRIAPGADDALHAEVLHRPQHLGEIGVGEDVDHDRQDRTDGLDGRGIARLAGAHGGDLGRDLIGRVVGAGPRGTEARKQGLGPRSGRHLYQVRVVGQVGIDLEAHGAQRLDLAGRHRPRELDQNDVVRRGIGRQGAQGLGKDGLGAAGVDRHRLQRDDGRRTRLEARGLLGRQTGAEKHQKQERKQQDLPRSKHRESPGVGTAF